MKRILSMIIMVSVLVLLSGCGKGKDSIQPSKITFGNQAEEGAIEAYGTVTLLDVSSVVIDFPAYVKDINVKDGQKIGMGETVMILDIDDFKAQIREKESEIALLKEQNKGTNIYNDKIKALEEGLKLLKSKLNDENIKQDLVVSNVANGLVYDIGYAKGDMIIPGKKLVTIANLDSIIIRVNVSQEFIGLVKLGSKVTIIPENSRGMSYEGKVSFISSKAVQDNGETTIPVEIILNEKAEGLIIGSDVLAKIYPGEAK